MALHVFYLSLVSGGESHVSLVQGSANQGLRIRAGESGLDNQGQRIREIQGDSVAENQGRGIRGGESGAENQGRESGAENQGLKLVQGVRV